MTPSMAKSGFESPSLVLPGERTTPAFELKFLISEAQAQSIQDWARQRFMLDPHGDPAAGGAYRTTSLYFDTPELDVYFRSPSYRQRKFRMRQYGDSAQLFLERKTKRGDRVAKRRVVIPGAEAAWLQQETTSTTWAGHWFHERLQLRRLRPACRITYQRLAFVGQAATEPTRITFDRNLSGLLTDSWLMASVANGVALLSGSVILELKFRVTLPGLFKQLLADAQLAPTAVSKYRLCREAWGVTPLRQGEANA